jgi:YidC/Oxa1 family membrane protein insertase
MLSPNFFNSVFVFPILNLLVLFYKGLVFLRIPGAFGLAIIGLTIFVRLILNPFFKQQLETAKKMQDIKPHIDRLSLQHKKDPKRLQQEQMKLYQQAGINPASGCLFMIIQIPIFIALYQTLSVFLLHGGATKIISQINAVLYSPLLKIQSIDPWFFGFNLALTPAKAKLWFYYTIPVITAILQYLQVSVTTPAGKPLTSEVSGKQNNSKTSEVLHKDEKKNDTGDFQKAMNTQMKFIFPIMIGWFSYTLPVGLSLYWNIFSLFSIMQYRKMKKN